MKVTLLITIICLMLFGCGKEEMPKGKGKIHFYAGNLVNPVNNGMMIYAIQIDDCDAASPTVIRQKAHYLTPAELVDDVASHEFEEGYWHFYAIGFETDGTCANIYSNCSPRCIQATLSGTTDTCVDVVTNTETQVDLEFGNYNCANPAFNDLFGSSTWGQTSSHFSDFAFVGCNSTGFAALPNAPSDPSATITAGGVLNLGYNCSANMGHRSIKIHLLAYEELTNGVLTSPTPIVSTGCIADTPNGGLVSYINDDVIVGSSLNNIYNPFATMIVSYSGWDCTGTSNTYVFANGLHNIANNPTNSCARLTNTSGPAKGIAAPASYILFLNSGCSSYP